MTKNNTSNYNQALWLGIGQLCTFALSFISAAILSRYFDKQEYGTYKQILYVYTTLSSLFTIGLPSVFAYFIPRLNNGQQKTLITSLNRIFLFLGLLFSISLYILSKPIADLLNNPELAVGLKIFSPFPLFTLPTMGVEGIYTALKKTKNIALYQIVSKTLMIICIITPVVFFNSSYRVAIIGWGIASFITFLIAMYMKNRPYVKVQKELVPNMYKTIFDYSLPLMGAFVAGFFIASADQFFISRFYGTETFALYSNGSLSIPIATMVSSSVKQVLLPFFSQADANGTMNSTVQTYNNAVSKSATLVFPMLIFCMFYTREIMAFIYGNQYVESDTFMRFHIIRDFVEVFPYYSVLLAIGSSKFYMYMHVFGALFVWLFDLIVVKTHLDASYIVLVRSAFYILSSIIAFKFIFRRTKVNLISHRLLKKLLIIFIHCFISVCIVFYISNSQLSGFNNLLILVISAILFYSIIIISGRFIKINYIESFQLLLKRK